MGGLPSPPGRPLPGQTPALFRHPPWADPLADTPLRSACRDTVNKRAVRILLESILCRIFHHIKLYFPRKSKSIMRGYGLVPRVEEEPNLWPQGYEFYAIESPMECKECISTCIWSGWPHKPTTQHDNFYFTKNIYRCGKVMFLHISAILSTGGSGRHSPWQTPLGKHPLPRETPPRQTPTT